MNKAGILFLLQIVQTIFNVGLFTLITLLFYKIKDKTLKGMWKKAGVCKPKKGDFLRSFKIISIAYLFTILIFIIFKIVNGGISVELLSNERETCSVFAIILMILMVGFRSGFGEELLFRGAIGKTLINKFGITKGNILQSLIFTLPHILTFVKLPGLESIFLLMNAFVIGLAFGYITYKEDGCIIPVMVWHGIINMIAIPIAWFIL